MVDAEKRPGIYEIKNGETGMKYIGRSVNLDRRIRAHQSMFRNGYHRNYLVERDLREYGKESFTFGVLLYCSRDYIQFFENLFFEKLGGVPKSSDCLYNVRRESQPVRGSLNVSEQTKESMSEAQKKRMEDESERRKIARSLENYYEENEHPLKGQSHDEEVCRRISDSLQEYYRKNPHPNEGREYRSRELTEDHKEAISEGLKGRSRSEEVCQMLSENMQKRHEEENGLVGQNRKFEPVVASMVRSIKELTGCTQKKLANLYGCSEALISKVVNRKGWYSERRTKEYVEKRDSD